MKIIKLMVAILASIAVTACGSSSGGSSTGNTTGIKLGGVVASGSPIANSGGYILDASTGTTTAFTTDANGVYSSTMTGTGPFLIHVIGISTSNTQVNMYSLASSADTNGIVNVTPLSDVVVGFASSLNTQTLEANCLASISTCPTMLNNIISNLSASNTAFVNGITPAVWATLGVSNTTGLDLIHTAFTAGSHTSIDKVLDSVAVVPPPSGAKTGAYQVNLAGTAATTTLVSMPTTGTAPTTTNATLPTPTAGVSTISTAQAAQAANYNAILPGINTMQANFSALWATAIPTATAITNSGIMDASFKLDGYTAAQIATFFASGPNSGVHGSSGAYGIGTVFKYGGLAPYPATPGSTSTTPSITYDANNCVTSVWGTGSINGHVTDSGLLKNTGYNTSTCLGGTWTWAGNQRNYKSSIHTHIFQWNDAGKTVVNELVLDTKSSAVNAFGSVTFSGTGLVTYGNQTTEAPVLIIRADPNLSDLNVINDPYYRNTVANSYYSGTGGIEGTSHLRSCAFLAAHPTGTPWSQTPTAATPCYNNNVAAGSNYTVSFYSGTNGTGLLETHLDQLAVSPNAVYPTSWFPTGTVTTSTSPLVQGSTATVNWTIPSGAISARTHLNLNDTTGQTVYNFWHGNFQTTTSRIITIQAMPGASAVGNNFAIVGVTMGNVDLSTALAAF